MAPNRRPTDDAADHFQTLIAEYPETFPTPARVALGIDQASNRHFDTVVMGRYTYDLADVKTHGSGVSIMRYAK